MNKGYTLKLASVLLLVASLLNSCTKENPLDTDARDKFVGNWTCNEKVNGTAMSTFTVTISKSVTVTNTTDILMANFYQLGNNFKAIAQVNGNNVTIASQNIDGFTVSGSGSMSGTTTITLNYTADDGSGAKNITDTYTK